MHANFDRLLHLHLTQYSQPEWREMLSEVNARGTLRVHSNNVSAAQTEIVDLTLNALPSLERYIPDRSDANMAAWQQQPDMTCFWLAI